MKLIKKFLLSLVAAEPLAVDGGYRVGPTFGLILDYHPISSDDDRMDGAEFRFQTKFSPESSDNDSVVWGSIRRKELGEFAKFTAHSSAGTKRHFVGVVSNYVNINRRLDGVAVGNFMSVGVFTLTFADDSAFSKMDFNLDDSFVFPAVAGCREADDINYNFLADRDDGSCEFYETDEFNENWGLRGIQADAAYHRGYYGQGVTVVVVDRLNCTDNNDIIVQKEVFTPLIVGRDLSDCHGLNSAGIVGALRNDRGVHGVAPSVSIVRVEDGPTFGRNMRFLYGYSHWEESLLIDAPIYSVSSGPFIEGELWNMIDSNGMTVSIALQSLPDPRVVSSGDSAREIENQLLYPHVWDSENTDTRNLRLAASDNIWVIANGNDGYNSVNGKSKDKILAINGGVETMLDFMPNTDYTFSNGGAERFTFTLSQNIPSADVAAPLRYKGLLGRIIGVVALGNDEDIPAESGRFFPARPGIADFSNGCGVAKMWCISAPGIATRTLDNHNELAFYGGTSAAAPHVSGALALLKGKNPKLKMDIIGYILLSTATDMGETGVDEVYGRGGLMFRRR